MNDLIRRKDTIEAVERVCNGDSRGLTFIELINDIPSVERNGKWIEHRPPTNDYCGMVECPFCGEELVGEPTDFNFCPHCGADMGMKGADDD